MSGLRFNHVFVGLMLLSVAGAFWPGAPRLSDPARAQAQSLFSPVSRPVRLVTGWIYDRFQRDRPDDESPRPRTVAELLEENRQLRLSVANLATQLEAMKELNADRAAVGDVRPLCTPVPVSGAGAGGGLRQTLNLAASGDEKLREGLPVLYAGGIAGRIDRAALGGAQVRLITDPGFRVTGSFARFIKNSQGVIELVRIATPPALVEGVGQGSMLVRNLALRDVEGAALAEGDWVILNDADWPTALQGYRLGKIISLGQRGDGPLFAEIRIHPAGKLLTLREVMVMTKN